MSTPFGGGSQPMPGQWPDSTTYQPAYLAPDPNRPPLPESRQQHQAQIPYGVAPPTAAPQPPYTQKMDSGSPHQYNTFNPSADVRGSQQSLTDATDKKLSLGRRP